MDTLRQKLTEILETQLEDSYDCTRVWEGWRYNTMKESDFIRIPDDSDRIEDIVNDILEAVGEESK